MALRAWFRIGGDPFPAAFDLMVESDTPQELFSTALERAYSAEPVERSSFDLHLGQWRPLWIWIGGRPDDDVWLSWESGDELTAAEAEAFLGPEGQGPPPQIELDFGGRGGSGLQIAKTIVDVVTGNPVSGLLALLVEGETRAVAIANRQYRGLYEDWRDDGGDAVPMPLEQAVRSERYWDHATFMRRFGASDGGASKLLRRLQYAPGRDGRGRRYWLDTTT